MPMPPEFQLPSLLCLFLRYSYMVLRKSDQRIGSLSSGEKLVVAVVAQDVDALREVVVLILVVIEPALAEGDVVFAVFDPFLGVFRVVIAGAEGASHRRRGQRRAFAARQRDCRAPGCK